MMVYFAITLFGHLAMLAGPMPKDFCAMRVVEQVQRMDAQFAKEADLPTRLGALHKPPIDRVERKDFVIECVELQKLNPGQPT